MGRLPIDHEVVAWDADVEAYMGYAATGLLHHHPAAREPWMHLVQGIYAVLDDAFESISGLNLAKRDLRW